MSLRDLVRMEVASLTIPTGLAATPVHLSDSVLMSRGFETVSYMLEGEFTHEDFLGNKGTLKPGDLQWMTAGTVWDALHSAVCIVKCSMFSMQCSLCSVQYAVHGPGHFRGNLRAVKSNLENLRKLMQNCQSRDKI